MRAKGRRAFWILRRREIGRVHSSVQLLLLSALAALFLLAAPAMAAPETPHIVSRDGKHALMVDGAPFLMLAAQANNSSNYPAMLPKVWPMIKTLEANTLLIPVAWEQIEPVEGRFDFSYLDVLLKQARENDVRLVLLWFATWKNTAPNYAPGWVKLDNKRFPRMINAKGETHYALSPFAKSTLDADRTAFVRLMRYLKDNDPQNTVIMVQPQNEVGTYGGSVRDYSPEASRLFNGPVPADIAKKLGKQPGTWTQTFGRDAEMLFHAWAIASYVDAIAEAGKAVKPLPMYVNAALPGSPFGWHDPNSYASGGPVPAALDMWKAAAPSIDFRSPDIYNPDHKAYLGFLDHYARPDNALFVPETGNAKHYARYFFPVIGRGAIGFSPFGMDATGYFNYPLGAKALDDETIGAFAENYRLFAPMQREWAKIAFEKKVWGVAEPTDAEAKHTQVIELGKYRATVTFGRPQFGKAEPEANPEPSGGLVIAELAPDEYLVTGFRARIDIDPVKAGAGPLMFDRVEEGHFDNGKWVFERVWNGDQTDYGLNFTSARQVLKVRLASYR